MRKGTLRRLIFLSVAGLIWVGLLCLTLYFQGSTYAVEDIDIGYHFDSFRSSMPPNDNMVQAWLEAQPGVSNASVTRESPGSGVIFRVRCTLAQPPDNKRVIQPPFYSFRDEMGYRYDARYLWAFNKSQQRDLTAWEKVRQGLAEPPSSFWLVLGIGLALPVSAGLIWMRCRPGRARAKTTAPSPAPPPELGQWP